MKRCLYILILSSIFLFTAVSCQNSGSRKIPNIKGEITVTGLGDDHWTYISIENGTIVGTGEFMSKEDDESWRQRTDWDFAICGDYMKTNSGTSGIGSGGILRDEEHHFLTLETAPEDGYLIDEYNVVK